MPFILREFLSRLWPELLPAIDGSVSIFSNGTEGAAEIASAASFRLVTELLLSGW